MKKFLIIMVFAVLSMINPNSAKAAIVDLTGDRFQDQNTGFIWQDIGQYYNQTTTDIRNNLAGTGFHLATLAELQELQSGLPLSAANWYIYESIMGAVSPNRSIIWGFYEDNAAGVESYSWAWGPLNGLSADWEFATSSTYNNYFFDDLGAWVVCDSAATCTDTGNVIPEPASMLLLGSGLIGSAFFRRKKRS